MDDEKFCIVAIIVAIGMVGGIAALTYIDENGWPWEKEEEKEEILVVKEGDEVSLDYTGYFLGPNGNLGPVFDTSLRSVAEDDTISKSPGFTEKGTYDDLTFTVVAKGEKGDVVPGFNEGIKGMKVGDTKQVTVPTSMGYGDANEKLRLYINSTQKIPMEETIDMDDFESMFPRVDIKNDTQFNHPFWGWRVDIVDHSPAEVTIMNRPTYGESYTGFPWNTTITDLSTERNTITLDHQVQEITDDTKIAFSELIPYDFDWFREAERSTQNPPKDSYVTVLGGEIVIDFNREVVGRTLIFQITLNNINRE